MGMMNHDVIASAVFLFFGLHLVASMGEPLRKEYPKRCSHDLERCDTLTLFYIEEPYKEAKQRCKAGNMSLPREHELHRYDVQTPAPVFTFSGDDYDKECYIYESKTKKGGIADCTTNYGVICISRECIYVEHGKALCPDGKIISSGEYCDVKCNGTKNNGDCFGKVCSKHEFSCENYACISRRLVCNGERNCLGEEDEKGPECGENMFLIVTAGKPHTEATTATTPMTTSSPKTRTLDGCTDTQYSCGDGQCVPQEGICTAKAEGCKNGNHKYFCDRIGISKEETKCRSWEFSCGDGQCVPQEDLCDNNIAKCKNGEDGKYCDILTERTKASSEAPVTDIHAGRVKASPEAPVTGQDGNISTTEIALTAIVCVVVLTLLVFIVMIIWWISTKGRQNKNGMKTPEEENKQPLNDGSRE